MIINIKLSFLKLAEQIGVITAIRFNNNAFGGYNLIDNYIVLNLPLIKQAIINKDKCPFFLANKTIEQAVCYILTHEEIHAWLNENIGPFVSTKFDNIAEKFMEGM